MFKIIRNINLSLRVFFFAMLFAPVIAVAQNQLGWQLLHKYALSSQKLICPEFIQSTHHTYQVCFPSKLESVYAANDFYPLWTDESLRNELVVQLKSLAFAELVPGLEQRLAELEVLSKKEDLRGYDILATDTLFVYKSIVTQLQAQPSWLFKHQTFDISQSPSVELNRPLSTLSLTEELRKLRPQIKRFERSVALAERLRQQPSHQLELSGHNRFIQKNQPITNGHILLDVLYSYGDISQVDYEELSDQDMIVNSGEVNYAIKAFQRRNGLDDDGVIGPATANQLTLPYSEVARVIALNLQRSRFGSRETDRPLIQVNIPDYMLRVTKQDELLFESKVIVGRTSRPTYLFSSSLNTMVVNPYWNVPNTIKQEDVIPRVKESLNYLAKKNLKIVKSWSDRSVIMPEQIEWSSVNPETFPYEFQQGPGPSNALGKVKFLMPNDYSVYLHDTPSRGLFNKKKRNFSSGCVRVEKADELAEFILEHQSRSGIASYEQMVKDVGQDTVSLARRVDVDFMYLTAWVDENQQLQLREDIYGYDRPGKKRVEPQYITLKDFSY